jgi:hypothetical protein
VSIAHEAVAQVRPDESCSARDENFHTREYRHTDHNQRPGDSSTRSDREVFPASDEPQTVPEGPGVSSSRPDTDRTSREGSKPAHLIAAE